jgi:hypothetical protein
MSLSRSASEDAGHRGNGTSKNPFLLEEIREIRHSIGLPLRVPTVGSQANDPQT